MNKRQMQMLYIFPWKPMPTLPEKGLPYATSFRMENGVTYSLFSAALRSFRLKNKTWILSNEISSCSISDAVHGHMRLHRLRIKRKRIIENKDADL